jgi:penicillin-binding protein 1C
MKKRYVGVGLLIAFALIVILIPLTSPLFKDDYSTIITDEAGQLLRVYLNKDDKYLFPIDIKKTIPPKLRIAALYFEDQYFKLHPGINPPSLIRAYFQNKKAGKIISGGSTITMQLARLANPRPRTYINKLVEAIQALKIELLYSKKEILSLYLNHAPYGSNIVGYKAAALMYYGKQADELSWAEAATLAVLPNAPGLINPINKRDLLLIKRNNLLRRLQESKVIDNQTCKNAQKEPIPDTIKYFKITAPHFCRKIFQEEKRGTVIKTTLSKITQKEIEKLVKQHVRYFKSLGVNNCSVIVAETQSGKVRAYVGSHNFYDKKNNGQVDGVMAYRSTASALKPFLYALSMDRGLILPETIIQDIPSYYFGFSPANPMHTFDGIVQSKEALIRSLNIPAVRLLNSYGVTEFYGFLKAAGIKSLFRSPDDYGLPLILGGAEASLYDLTTLFRGLGNLGKFSDLVLLENSDGVLKYPKNGGKEYISPGAAYLTLDILRDVKRPGAEYYWQQYANQWPLAWKTGTSYGQRDAWAIGVSPEWVIGVWVGDFDGRSNKNLGGARFAGPLLFDIFNTLPKSHSKRWFSRPDMELGSTAVCQETGFVAGQHCPNSKEVNFPISAKPLKICPFHRSIYLTMNEKYRVCSRCWATGDYKKVTRLFYSPEVMKILRSNSYPIIPIPPHNSECTETFFSDSVKITYPEAGAKIWLPKDIDGKDQKLAVSAAHREAKKIIYWYVDKVYIGITEGIHNKAIRLDTGVHLIDLVDENGNHDSVNFSVVAN